MSVPNYQPSVLLMSTTTVIDRSNHHASICTMATTAARVSTIIDNPYRLVAKTSKVLLSARNAARIVRESKTAFLYTSLTRSGLMVLKHAANACPTWLTCWQADLIPYELALVSRQKIYTTVNSLSVVFRSKLSPTKTKSAQICSFLCATPRNDAVKTGN